MRKKIGAILPAILVWAAILSVFTPDAYPLSKAQWIKEALSGGTDIGSKGTRTQDSVITKIRPKNLPILKKMFSDKGLSYPPKKARFIAVKEDDISTGAMRPSAVSLWATGRSKSFIC